MMIIAVGEATTMLVVVVGPTSSVAMSSAVLRFCLEDEW